MKNITGQSPNSISGWIGPRKPERNLRTSALMPDAIASKQVDMEKT